MKFLIIGCGSIGQRHLRNLQTLCTSEIWAFDVLEPRRKEAEQRYGVRTFSSLDQAWEAGPEVALITAPTSLHIPLALEAAAHNCHLFIEKPLSHTLDSVDELLAQVRAKKLVTLVGCNMRFHPGLRKVKELLERGTIGRVLAARVQFGQYLPSWHPQEDYRKGYSAQSTLGGGIILDAIHELDYICWMLGKVREVFCFADKLSHLEIDTEDTAAILLKFESGAIGEVHLDYVQRAYSRSCQFIGEEGTLLWDFNEKQVRLYTAGSSKWAVFEEPKGYEINQMYVDEMRHFLRCLRGEEASMLDVFESRRVLEIALAAKASAKSGCVVILQS